MVASELNNADVPVAVVARAPDQHPPASPMRKSQQPSPASPGAAHSATMKASLGHRGGVVKMSDGFEVFYGLVGDQPAPTSAELGSPVKSTAPALAARSPVKPLSGSSLAPKAKQTSNNGHVATSLAHRGGFVRKSDGFEVFYGLVGDQPGMGEASQAEAGAVTAERCNSDLGELSAVLGQGATGTPPRTDAAAMFSLATPAPSYAPGPSHASGCADLRLEDSEEEEEAATITWLGAPRNDSVPQRPAAEFCMATPAASFAPVCLNGECETAITEEYADGDKVASIGDHLAQQLEHLGAAAAPPLKAAAAQPSESSMTGKVQPTAAISDILERMGNWKPLGLETRPLNQAGAVPEKSKQKNADPAAVETAAAEKPMLAKRHGKSFDNAGLHSRLASLDDAIARLKTLR